MIGREGSIIGVLLEILELYSMSRLLLNLLENLKIQSSMRSFPRCFHPPFLQHAKQHQEYCLPPGAWSEAWDKASHTVCFYEDQLAYICACSV